MIFELFSQRNKNNNEFDVYEYDNFPGKFRNQVYFIVFDFINLFKQNYELSHGFSKKNRTV